jgi:hypothetical protein
MLGRDLTIDRHEVDVYTVVAPDNLEWPPLRRSRQAQNFARKIADLSLSRADTMV